MTTKPTSDAQVRLKEELDGILILLAERDMDARDVFAACIQQNDAIRRKVSRIHRAAGFGDPAAYKSRASIFREFEVAS